jgi:hypothetical protein
MRDQSWNTATLLASVTELVTSPTCISQTLFLIQTTLKEKYISFFSNEVGGACSMYVGGERYIQDFGGKIPI